MKTLFQKTFIFLFIAFISCEKEKTIQSENSDELITTDSIMFNVLSKNSNEEGFKCSEIIYPIALSTYDSNNAILKTEKINTDLELQNFLTSITDDIYVTLNYPVKILIISNSTVISVNNNEELIQIIELADETCEQNSDIFKCVIDFFKVEYIVIDADNNPNDGITKFTIDLNLDCKGLKYDLKYFEDKTDAESNVNQINFPYTLTPNFEKLYVRAETTVSSIVKTQIVEINITVKPNQAIDCCPSEQIGNFLKQCKWKIENYSGSEDFSNYKFKFNRNETFSYEDEFGITGTNDIGVWVVTDDNGEDAIISLNFASNSRLFDLGGNWNITACNLNGTDSSLDINNQTFTFKTDCN